MSIFLKDCPECASANPIHALSCRCGYSFDAQRLNKRKDDLAQLEQEEQLYLEYLHARVAQTGSELKARQSALAMAPEDTARAAEVLIAQQALATARAELRGQIDKLDTLRKRGQPSIRAAATRPAVPPTKPMSAGRVAAPAAYQPPRQAVTPAPVATTAPAAHKPPVAQPRRPAASAAPTEAFRAAQSAKAAQVVTQKTAATAAPMVAAPVPVLPAAHQAAAPQAPTVSATLPATHDCPNCTARLPVARDRCGCGYNFASSAELPPLVLSAEDRKSLLNKLGYGS